MSAGVGAAVEAMVLAHGGGAPEAAMVGVPLLIIAIFGWLELRARKRERAAGGDGPSADQRQQP